jgi:hypothetical protein
MLHRHVDQIIRRNAPVGAGAYSRQERLTCSIGFNASRVIRSSPASRSRNYSAA